MRYDMHEVVIERPRRGSRYRYHNKRPRGTIEQLERLPSREGMRRPYGYDTKEFSDLLGPLRGFLISRVGKRWDDVYLEIRERLNPNSTVQIHILSHVFQYVERHAKLGEKGELWTAGRYGYYRGISEFYVHPTTGILCRVPEVRAPWKRPKPKVVDTIKIGDREARRIGGIWYWIHEIVESVPIVNPRGPVRWCKQTRLVKRQLNHRDIGRYVSGEAARQR